MDDAFIKHDHRIYDKFVGTDKFEQLMNDLAQPGRLPYGLLKELSAKYRVSEDTLKTWRKNLKADPTYRPRHNFKGDPRRINQALDTAVKTRLENEYLAEKRYCPRASAQDIARQTAATEGVAGFHASPHWLSNFCDRNDLSFRASHIRRRTKLTSLQILPLRWSSLRKTASSTQTRHAGASSMAS